MRLPKRKRPKERKVDRADWRLAGTIALLVLTAIGFLVYATRIRGPRNLTDIERSMLRDYDAIRLALARDDLPLAGHEAARFLQAYGGDTDFGGPVKILSEAASLSVARSAFAQMSKTALELTHKNPAYVLISCSMDRCPAKCSPCEMSKYSNWVQLDSTVGNPFMGLKNPNCGIVKEMP